MKLRKPDCIQISGDDSAENTRVDLELADERLKVYLTSTGKVEYVSLRWNWQEGEKRTDAVRIMGDAFERSYADLSWRGMEPDRPLPWYFAVSNGSDANRDYTGRYTECFGVEVRPNAFCTWYYDSHGMDLVLDVRNGGQGVELAGRKLAAATVLFAEYRDMSAFHALKDFCCKMSPAPLKAKDIIYGSNNWYYAYGKSSSAEILSDTDLVRELCKNCPNKPFMVVDDGWSPIDTSAPWVANERFGDMKQLAGQMEKKGVIPGIWVRYLFDEKLQLDLPAEARRQNHPQFLDPTHPAVKAFVAETTRNLVDWGYRLIKHDYSSYDISLGVWGGNVKGHAFVSEKEGFYDRSKTTAEIVIDFYTQILQSAGDAYILGCNTFSHLCAGLVHANRIGDDTSGRSWIRTRSFGINTIAFRLCQNGSFYVADADCVGILEDNIPWKLNRQWLELVSYSGSSLFVSCQPKKGTGEIFADLQKNFVVASRQQDEMIPLDWMENCIPEKYLVNGEVREYDWSIDGRIPGAH